MKLLAIKFPFTFEIIPLILDEIWEEIIGGTISNEISVVEEMFTSEIISLNIDETCYEILWILYTIIAETSHRNLMKLFEKYMTNLIKPYTKLLNDYCCNLDKIIVQNVDETALKTICFETIIDHFMIFLWNW